MVSQQAVPQQAVPRRAMLRRAMLRAVSPVPCPCAKPRHAGTTRYRFLGVHQDRVAHHGGYQSHADFLATLTGIDEGESVGEHADDSDLDSCVRASDAYLAMALRNAVLGHRHATTPGASTPGCSKNACTSSHSTW
jgi:hypothetical protein